MIIYFTIGALYLKNGNKLSPLDKIYKASDNKDYNYHLSNYIPNHPP